MVEVDAEGQDGALPEAPPVPMAVDEPDEEMPEAPPEAPDVEPPLPEPEIDEPQPFEDPWQAIDPHENVVKGRPLKVGKTVSKVPARLYRPLAEMTLTDPFEQSDMWNLLPQRGLLRKLGLEEFEDCEDRVLAEISRRRAERLKANRGDTPALEDEDDLLGEGDENDAEGEEDKEEEEEPHLATPSKKEAEKKWVDGADAQSMSPSRRGVEFQRKMEDAQRNYDMVLKQKLDELNLYDGAMGGIQHVYATVRKWQDQLEPILAEQDSRRHFDIHTYGKELIRKIGTEAGDKGDFIEAMRSFDPNMPKWEMFRYFLSALVLTNNGNVNIDDTKAPLSFDLEMLEGGRAIGLDGQELNECAVEAEPEAPAAEGPAKDPAPKKRAKKEKNAAAKSGEDVAEPAEAAHEDVAE